MSPVPVGIASPQRAGLRTFIALIPGFLFSNVEGTLVNIALPVMQRDLELSMTEIAWIPVICLLTTAALSPLMGILADRLGRKRVYFAGLSVVSLGSLTAALAPGFLPLLAGRTLQGLGAAAVVANGLAIMAEQYGENERGRMLGRMTALMAVGAMVAPVVGSIASEHLGWRSIFGIELLIVLPGALLIHTHLPATAPTTQAGWRNIPWWCAAMLFVSTTAGVLGLWGIGEWGWANPLVIIIFAFTLVAFGATHLLNRDTVPLIDLKRVPAHTAWSLATLCLGNLILGGLSFSLPLFLANTRGLSGLQLGLAVLPLPAGLVLGSLAGGALGDRRGNARPELIGLGLAAVGIATYDYFGLASLLIAGIGLGGFSVGNNAELVSGQTSSVGLITGLAGFLRRVGNLTGVALVGLFIQIDSLNASMSWIAWLVLPTIVTSVLRYRHPQPRPHEPV